jgi:hypothetical protein
LDEALAWRRIEMRALIGALMSAEAGSADSPLSRALARSCAALIYAHWEGFIKESCQCYVDFVAVRRLKFGELNDGLLRTALLGMAKRLISGDEAGTAALLDAVRRPQEARAKIPKNTMVDTKSNLRFNVLCEILESAGFSADAFSMKSHFIDKSLCDVRNSVAHGRGLFPKVEDVETMHSEVIGMMELVRDMIMASVRENSYRNARETAVN